MRKKSIENQMKRFIFGQYVPGEKCCYTSTGNWYYGYVPVRVAGTDLILRAGIYDGDNATLYASTRFAGMSDTDADAMRAIGSAIEARALEIYRAAVNADTARRKQ